MENTTNNVSGKHENDSVRPFGSCSFATLTSKYKNDMSTIIPAQKKEVHSNNVWQRTKDDLNSGGSSGWERRSNRVFISTFGSIAKKGANSFTPSFGGSSRVENRSNNNSIVYRDDKFTPTFSKYAKKKYNRIRHEVITADPYEWEDYMDVEKYLEENEKPPHFLTPIKTNIGSDKRYSPEVWKKCFTSPDYIDCEDPLDWEEYSNVKFVSRKKRSPQRGLTKVVTKERDVEMERKMEGSVMGEMYACMACPTKN